MGIALCALGEIFFSEKIFFQERRKLFAWVARPVLKFSP